MITPDNINGFFEGFGSLLLVLNIKRLLKDQKIEGVSILPVIFWTLWGFWNLYYYPSLHQWCSFVGGLGVVTMNTVWIVLALYYHHYRTPFEADFKNGPFRKTEIRTFLRGKFDLAHPTPQQVHIEDIAHGLANCNRFTGQSDLPYSVAQHSVLASYLVPREEALDALMHDAHEAYTNDLNRPLKYLPGMESYRKTTDAIQKIIARRFRFSPVKSVAVQIADQRMYVTEARDVMGGYVSSMSEQYPPTEERIVPWSHVEAEERFRARFDELHPIKEDYFS